MRGASSPCTRSERIGPERGRDVRHALRELLAHERCDRIVLAAETPAGGDGFTLEETAWLLANAPGEIVVLRPAGARLAPRAAAPATPRAA